MTAAASKGPVGRPRMITLGFIEGGAAHGYFLAAGGLDTYDYAL